jgi:thiol-disulfide isomerase/thioredoxin
MKGKVVLIDCWAGWCSPCMAKMPQLKTLYEGRHGDGFEVIGVNFDKDRTRGEQLVKTVALPWPEVFVPGDDRTRRLWTEGPGIASLPRLLLIDREGILRWDGSPAELEERIAALLDTHRPGR